MSLALLIGLVATVAIVVQNSASAMAFTWAAIHGAGLSSTFAFVPAGIALSVLWAGYVLMKRRNVGRITLLFAAYASAVLVANEIVLPMTPFDVWRNRRYAQSVEVRNIRDEVYLSARGNPIGIRLTFDAVVPHTAVYEISGSVMMPSVEGASSYALAFDHSTKHLVEPQPEPDGDRPYGVFREGIVYTFTQEMLPHFLSYDDRTSAPCFTDPTTKNLSREQFQAALSKATAMKFRTEITVNVPYGETSVVAREYVTSRAYDARAMYDTIAKENDPRCAEGR
jgi:hypothetical protein